MTTDPQPQLALLDIVRRDPAPAPWSEGDKIPWHDPAFSRRMLAEHLSQAHDGASRRAATIDRHVGWIHREVLAEQPARVLDLGCGPGLYTARLAALGHTCVGIDFAPAAIEHAREQAHAGGLACEYRFGDVREAAYGDGYDLVMLLYGELNVFRREDAATILRKARAALAPGGQLLLEPHSWDAVRGMGDQPPRWRGAERGLFSDAPHLRLEESFWDDAAQVAIHRYYVVDAASGAVTRHAECLQAYRDDDYARLLAEAGFALRRTRGALDGSLDRGELIVLIAEAV